QLLSVPYALHSKTAENAHTVNYDSITNIPANLTTIVNNNFSGDYSQLTNTPTIPANVSELNNDAGYLITEVDGSITNELQIISISNDTIYLSSGGFVKLPAGFSGNYNDLTNVPPNLTTIVNNNFSGDYNELTNTPAIQTYVSELTNDAGYLITEVDGSVTNELQVLSISNDTIYLTNGGLVKLPAGFSGDYNDLTNTPSIPSNLSELANDAGYLSAEIDGSVTNELQALSFSNDTLYLSNGNFVKLPYNANDLDADTTNEYQALSISNDTIYLSNGDYVKLPYKAGNGITISNDSIINTVPDQIINLTGSYGTTVTGTYPNYTIYSSSSYNELNFGNGNEGSLDVITGTTTITSSPHWYSSILIDTGAILQFSGIGKAFLYVSGNISISGTLILPWKAGTAPNTNDATIGGTAPAAPNGGAIGGKAIKMYPDVNFGYVWTDYFQRIARVEGNNGGNGAAGTSSYGGGGGGGGGGAGADGGIGGIGQTYSCGGGYNASWTKGKGKGSVVIFCGGKLTIENGGLIDGIGEEGIDIGNQGGVFFNGAGGQGGGGGGQLIIFCSELEIKNGGAIFCDGGRGGNGGGYGGHTYAGGGGGGGMIIFVLTTYSNSGTVSCNGGSGGLKWIGSLATGGTDGSQGSNGTIEVFYH
ncbi:MAG: hypothetical protein HY738_13120, partial [Bacteroidia bacterium]|nr:hypothetical protein [Bacteroidia bacterium]